MKTRILTALTLSFALVAGASYAADKEKEAGIAGKWATDAVATAVEKKTKGGALDSLLQSGMQAGANAAPTGNRNNGGFGGSNNRNGGFGGREFAQFGGQQQQGFGNNNGGAFGNNNQGGNGVISSRSGIRVDTNGPQTVQEGFSADGVALTMVLTVNKTKLTGEVTDVVEKKTLKIEDAKIDGNKFHFAVYKKVNNVGVATNYDGELSEPNRITLTRTNPSGKNIDFKADGTVDVLIFNRGK